MGNSYSTFQPAFNQQSDGRTIKTLSPAVSPGETTDATIGPSILDLPIENLQKLQGMKNNSKNGKDNGQKQKNNPNK